MTPSLIIVFGLTGVGKTYVADVLKNEFGYASYNADRSLPRAMRAALFRREIITIPMRDAFLTNILRAIRRLAKKHPRLVVHQALHKDSFRKKIAEVFPDAKFILVTADTNIREGRYIKRKYFNLGLAYLRHMSALFDPPTIAHVVLTNTAKGKGAIRPQLLEFFRG